MDFEVEETAATLKKMLIGRNQTAEHTAIAYIKNDIVDHNQSKYVKSLLQMNIHNFLLNRLLSTDYPVVVEILKCIEYFCSHDIYFIYDQTFNTPEIILKSIFFQIKQDGHDEFILLAVNVITAIINRLIKNSSEKLININNYITAIDNIIKSKHNPDLIHSSVELFNVLLSWDLFHKRIDQDILNNIFMTWQICVIKLSELLTTHKVDSFIIFCNLCDVVLHFSQKFENVAHPEVLAICTKMKEASANCEKDIFMSYILELDFNFSHFAKYSVYLRFLNTLLHINLPGELKMKLCTNLVTKKNFCFVAQCINFTDDISDASTKLNFRNLCILIMSEVMSNLAVIKKTQGPFDIIQYKQYAIKELEKLPNNINVWTDILQYRNCSYNTKILIIMFSCYFYIHSDNLNLLKPRHLSHLSQFIKELPSNTYLPEYILQQLWLLFAVMYTTIPNLERPDNADEANFILQKLVSDNTKMDDILTYHQNILFWVCSACYTYKKLHLAVFAKWLLKINEDTSCRAMIINTVKTYDSAGVVLLDIVRKGTPQCANAALSILQELLQEGYLTKNNKFLAMLWGQCTDVIVDMSNRKIVAERVIHATYILQLGAASSQTISKQVIQYNISTFANTFGTIGFSNAFPDMLYAKVLEYTNAILTIATEKIISEVFSELMSSKKMLQLFMTALLKGNGVISFQVSKFFNILLDYQLKYNLECQNGVRIQVEDIIALMTVSDQSLLLINLQIMHQLLSLTNIKTVITVKHPIDGRIVKGLHMRFSQLTYKPKAKALHLIAFKCLRSLLCYAEYYELNVIENLWNHSSSHILIQIYNDPDIDMPLSREFLEYINCLLLSVSKNSKLLDCKILIVHSLWDISVKLYTELLLKADDDTKRKNLDVIFSLKTTLLKLGEKFPNSHVEALQKLEI